MATEGSYTYYDYLYSLNNPIPKATLAAASAEAEELAKKGQTGYVVLVTVEPVRKYEPVNEIRVTEF